MPQAGADTDVLDDLDLLIDIWGQSLAAENKSPRTIEAYTSSARLLAAFLRAQGMPREVAEIRREHVEAFIVDQLDRYSPATASVRYRSLQAFWRYVVVVEAGVNESPMKDMKPPAVPLVPARVLSDDELGALLRACAGDDFEDVRDLAIIRVFATTGARLSEVASLRAEDVVLTRDERHLVVVGKGRKVRRLPLDVKTQRALMKYRQLRGRRSGADTLEAFWIGTRGAMTPSGVARVIRRRAKEAGLGNVHPHALRHSFAHGFLEAGGQETDLMAIAGWTTRTMVQRYASALAQDRAHAAFHRLGVGDRL